MVKIREGQAEETTWAKVAIGGDCGRVVAQEQNRGVIYSMKSSVFSRAWNGGVGLYIVLIAEIGVEKTN